MFMGLWIIVVLVAVIAVAGGTANSPHDARRSSGVDILDQRLARGELTPGEYAERRATLGGGSAGARTSWRPWAVAAAVVATLLLAGALTFGWGSGWGWTGVGWMNDHMGWGGTTATTDAPLPDAREVTVEAGDMWFEPDVVEVTAGEPVNLRLSNTGTTFHDLTVPDADFMLDAEAGEDVVGGLEFDEPGTYEFYCSVPGHADAGMRGTIEVTG